MSERKPHKNKHVEAALKYAESQGWSVVPTAGGSAHPWATVKCPYNKRTCRGGIWCLFGVWGTPASPEDFAKKIIKAVDKCEVHRQVKAGRLTHKET